MRKLKILVLSALVSIAATVVSLGIENNEQWLFPPNAPVGTAFYGFPIAWYARLGTHTAINWIRFSIDFAVWTVLFFVGITICWYLFKKVNKNSGHRKSLREPSTSETSHSTVFVTTIRRLRRKAESGGLREFAPQTQNEISASRY